MIQIGAPAPDHDRISTREFRENLEWAIVLPGDGEVTEGVRRLLAELTARGVKVFPSDCL
jgi:hypothetical protein